MQIHPKQQIGAEGLIFWARILVHHFSLLYPPFNPRTPLFDHRTPPFDTCTPSPYVYLRGTARYTFGEHRALTDVLPGFSYGLQGPCLQWEGEG